MKVSGKCACGSGTSHFVLFLHCGKGQVVLRRLYIIKVLKPIFAELALRT